VLILYSRHARRDHKVITVFVGGSEIPCRRECETVMAMDPEIESPVVTIPFGGVASPRGQNDDLTARMMISQGAPECTGPSFRYRSTRILNYLVIKVFVERSPGEQPGPDNINDVRAYGDAPFHSN
jgi:hypothetical protein